MKPELISLVGTVITALGLLAGVIYTQLQVRRAQARTAEIEKAKVDAGSYETARKNFESIIAAQSTRLDRLARELDDCSEDMDSMRKRVSDLEIQREQDAQTMRTVVNYCRSLLRILRNTEVVYPEPPLAVLED